MRSRNIKPGFFMNDLLAELPALNRLLFAGLWCLADRAGRIEDKPKRIKAELLPYDDCDVDVMLTALATRGFIVRYCVDGERYIQIMNFSKHQNPHQKEGPSIIPPVPDSASEQEQNKSGASMVQELCLNETRTVQAGLIPDSLIPDSLEYSSEISDETNVQDDEDHDGVELSAEQQTAIAMGDLLISELKRNNPAFLPPTGTKREKWDHTMQLMLTKDKRSPADMERIIRWCQSDAFWKGNVLSADSLRKHFDRFLVQSKAKPSGQVQAATPKRDNFQQRQYDDSFFDNISAAAMNGGMKTGHG